MVPPIRMDNSSEGSKLPSLLTSLIKTGNYSQVRGILFLIGRLKRRQQLLKLVQLEPSCSQKFTWFVF
jgi:hypothetical protein